MSTGSAPVSSSLIRWLLFNGRVRVGDPIAVCKLDGRVEETKVTKLFAFEGLRRVDITKPWPADLAEIAPERLTPTFVLVHDGRELDRLRGYPGDDFFWGLLGRMLEKVPGHVDTSSTPER